MSISRRSFLKFSLAGVAVTAGGLTVPLGSSAWTKSASSLRDENFPEPWAAELPTPRPIRGRRVRGRLQDGTEGEYRLVTVIERQADATILPGLKTPVYGYGYVDDAGQVRPVEVPGPTVDVTRGTPVKLRVINRLPSHHPQWGHPFATSTHLHGSASLPQYDGYADDLTYPGSYKDYWYPNVQEARTIWYHDHGVHHTAENAYGGLAAQYHLHDDAHEQDLPVGLPYDVPLTITDAMFSRDGRLEYDDHDFSGLWGDVILVNGQPWPYLEVHRRIYRFRVLNASLARSLRLVLSDGSPFVVVGTDGGLMPAPVTVEELKHAGAERYELLIDFSRYAAGATVDLLNRSNKNNRDYDHTDKVLQFRVVDGAFPTTRNTLEPRLPRHEIMDVPESASRRTRHFEMDHDDETNIFKINEKAWQDVQDSGYTLSLTGTDPPGKDDVEIWEFENNSGGWFHPLHIHLVDFRILSRNGRAPYSFEGGPKDVVYIGEGETVRLLIKYKLPPGSEGGKYMVHCHNLPHEDHDMMQQFTVGNADQYDPIASARPQPITWSSDRDGALLPGDGRLLG